MVSILLISHYYPPEIGAPQARLSEMASTWAQSGNMVSVITCMPNHPNGVIHKKYRGHKYLVERINGVNIYRCQTYATPNKGVIRKLLGHLVFMFNAVRQYRFLAKSANLILVSSPTFFSVFSAYVISKLYNKPYIFEVRDLWPAVFKELKVIKNKYILLCLEKLELFLYQKSIKVVTVTKSFTENIISRGIEKDKVSTITNGVDLQRFTPKKKNRGLIKSLSLKDKFIVLYIGAHGISHGLDKILKVAELLQHKKEVHFLFVGDGAVKTDLIKISKKIKLDNVSFVPSQPKKSIPNYYSIADVVLVPLKNIPLFDQFIPSKMFEIMAMGKPIIGSVRGEAANILKKSEGALICEPESIKKISSHVLTIYENKNLRDQLGQNGLSFVRKNYDRHKLAKSYEMLFKSVLT